MWKIILIIIGVLSIFACSMPFLAYHEGKDDPKNDKGLLKVGGFFIVLGIACIACAILFL